MKRIFIIGAVGVAAVAILLVGLVLWVSVTPARAQIGNMLSQAINGAQAVAFQAQTPGANVPGLQLKAEKGILVAGVFQDSPADKAGLVRGDIILDVDGQAVNTYPDLSGILNQHKVGDTLKLNVQHGDSQKSVSVTLAESPVATPSASAAPQSATPQSSQQNNKQNGRQGKMLSGPFLGIVPVGAGQFEGKGNFGGNQQLQAGARIVQVATGSPADKAGLKVGEVILSVDGTQINAQNSLQSLLSSHKPGDSVKLTVQGTDGTQRDVTVTLADNLQNAGTAYLGVAAGSFGRGFRFGLPGGQNGNGSGNGNSVNPHNFPNLAQHPGAYIQNVTANSPAEKAGLKASQVIESVDSTKIDNPQALSTIIAGHKSGDKVTLSVYDPQADKTSSVQVTLGDNPQKAGSAWLGIEYSYFNMQNVNPQGAPANNGTQF
jgi:VCBS repeat-containing protein